MNGCCENGKALLIYGFCLLICFLGHQNVEFEGIVEYGRAQSQSPAKVSESLPAPSGKDDGDRIDLDESTMIPTAITGSY